jgi:hypothetical protein
LLEPGSGIMFQEGLDRCWMQNKEFYLEILEDISERMTQLEMTMDELSLASGLEAKRLNHVFGGMVEDLTLLELDNIFVAVNAKPAALALA